MEKINKKNEIEKLKNALLEKIGSENDARYNNLSADEIMKIVIDSSNKGKYILWVLREYLKGNIQRFEDIESRCKQALTLFRSNLSKFTEQQKQLNKLSFQELESLVEPYQDVLAQNEIKRMNKEKIWEDIDVIYSGPEGKVYVPRTHEASVFLGQGTRWCTAAVNNNIFEYYSKQGPLYIFVTNDKDEQGREIKYQLHFESSQFMNSEDKAVDFGEFKKSKKIADIFFEKICVKNSVELNDNIKLFGVPKNQNNFLKKYFIESGIYREDILTRLWKTKNKSSNLWIYDEQEKRYYFYEIDKKYFISSSRRTRNILNKIIIDKITTEKYIGNGIFHLEVKNKEYFSIVLGNLGKIAPELENMEQLQDVFAFKKNKQYYFFIPSLNFYYPSIQECKENIFDDTFLNFYMNNIFSNKAQNHKFLKTFFSEKKDIFNKICVDLIKKGIQIDFNFLKTFYSSDEMDELFFSFGKENQNIKSNIIKSCHQLEKYLGDLNEENKLEILKKDYCYVEKMIKSVLNKRKIMDIILSRQIFDSDTKKKLIETNPEVIKIKNQYLKFNNDEKNYAAKLDISLFHLVEIPDEELCIKAVKKDTKNAKHIKKLTDEIVNVIIDEYPEYVLENKDLKENFLLKAFLINKKLLTHFEPSFDLWKKIIENKPEFISFYMSKFKNRYADKKIYNKENLLSLVNNANYKIVYDQTSELDTKIELCKKHSSLIKHIFQPIDSLSMFHYMDLSGDMRLISELIKFDDINQHISDEFLIGFLFYLGNYRIFGEKIIVSYVNNSKENMDRILKIISDDGFRKKIFEYMKNDFPLVMNHEKEKYILWKFVDEKCSQIRNFMNEIMLKNDDNSPNKNIISGFS